MRTVWLLCLLAVLNSAVAAASELDGGSVEGRGPYRPCANETWSLVSEDAQRDGSYSTSAASSIRRCLFGGDVAMDEFRYLSPSGEVTFRGVSFVLWSPDRQKSWTLWAMLEDPGVTWIEGTVRGDALTTSGSGTDRSGAFVERSRTIYPEEGKSLFEMDRSFDGGEHWVAPFNRIEGTLTSLSAPPLPDELVSAPADDRFGIRGPGVWHHAIRRVDEHGTPTLFLATERTSAILDGHALVAEVTETDFEGQNERRYLTFTARYAEPDRWRTVSWEPGPSAPVVEERLAGSTTGTIGEGNTAEGRTTTFEESSVDHMLAVVHAGDREVEKRISHRRRRSAAEWKARRNLAIVNQGCNDYAFLPGDWSLRAWTMNPDRSQKPGVGYMVGYETMDGTTISADMHVLFADGTGFRGTTLRLRDVTENRWHLYWITQGSSAEAQPGVVDGARTDLCEEAWLQREDSHGTFRDYLRLIDITEDSFGVSMHRIYGEGDHAFKVPDTWVYEASRIPLTDSLSASWLLRVGHASHGKRRVS